MGGHPVDYAVQSFLAPLSMPIGRSINLRLVVVFGYLVSAAVHEDDIRLLKMIKSVGDELVIQVVSTEKNRTRQRWRDEIQDRRKLGDEPSFTSWLAKLSEPKPLA